MKHAAILYTIVKRVLDREKREYPKWLVEHLKAIEDQSSSPPMTADEAMVHLDGLTKMKRSKKASG